MSHSADAIANWFLDRAAMEGKSLTPMQIQKLVYYAHAWHLAIDTEGRPLINEPLEAWRYGPVIRSLYREFRDFGNKPIDKKAVELDPKTLDLIEPSIEVEADSSGLNHALVQALLDRVWEILKDYSAIELSNMSHTDEEPWKQIWDHYSGIVPKAVHLPNELIRKCFKEKLASQATSAN